MQMLISPDGFAYCLYDETLDLAAIGRFSISRASHVEPVPDGNWVADLAPVGGPRLGPFPRRSDALRAEAESKAGRRADEPTSVALEYDGQEVVRGLYVLDPEMNRWGMAQPALPETWQPEGGFPAE